MDFMCAQKHNAGLYWRSPDQWPPGKFGLLLFWFVDSDQDVFAVGGRVFQLSVMHRLAKQGKLSIAVLKISDNSAGISLPLERKLDSLQKSLNFSFLPTCIWLIHLSETVTSQKVKPNPLECKHIGSFLFVLWNRLERGCLQWYAISYLWTSP